jgi:ribosome-associated protein
VRSDRRGRIDVVPDDDLVVNPSVRIPRIEVDERFTTSGGPGGQHANKTATRVELRFDAADSPSLSEWHRARIVDRLGPVVRVVVDETRSQTRNRVLAEERLVGRLAAALVVEAPRRPTRPTRGSKERRLQAKGRRSQLKADRRRPRPDV